MSSHHAIGASGIASRSAAGPGAGRIDPGMAAARQGRRRSARDVGATSPARLRRSRGAGTVRLRPNRTASRVGRHLGRRLRPAEPPPGIAA